MSPASSGRFDAELWAAYVKANRVFSDKVGGAPTDRPRFKGGRLSVSGRAPPRLLVCVAVHNVSHESSRLLKPPPPRHPSSNPPNPLNLRPPKKTNSPLKPPKQTKVVEELATDTDYVWVHDYHLLARRLCFCFGGV